MYMSNLIKESSNIEDLLVLVNTLTYKIANLEKKINVLESNLSLGVGINDDYNILDNAILDNTVFRGFQKSLNKNILQVPIVTRQNAFFIDF